MDKLRAYAFDFDGVIAKYDGFKGVDHFGEPNKPVVGAIRKLSEMGHKIIVHSTRGADNLKSYCEENDIPVDYYNENPELEGENKGKPIAYVYIDDRTVNYSGQSSEELVKEVLEFKAYWQK